MKLKAWMDNLLEKRILHHTPWALYMYTKLGLSEMDNEVLQL